MCGILYKIRDCLTTEAMLSIYYTLCYPHMIYCVSIWACTWPSFLNRMKVIQNKILRCIFYLKKFDSTANIYIDNRILNFNSVHKYFLLLTIYKQITNTNRHSVFYLSETIRSTRYNQINLVCPPYRTTLFKNCLYYFGPCLWNSLPLDIKTLVISRNVPLFKNQLKCYLLNIQHSQLL